MSFFRCSKQLSSLIEYLHDDIREVSEAVLTKRDLLRDIGKDTTYQVMNIVSPFLESIFNFFDLAHRAYSE